ncbi:LacI family transcriptional regulator [Paenibacillus psychroresistens]|uniref:LacI family transcriptional regulator n=1 Tax=Paenibacillus psychroresistens TaxID=1778678 RepID=A0A6B8RLV6_9BACL|nr:LacI family DNA-binding transcriptional regulator [Paenibacillus psychroresistens]QGQ97381.1 LacI family transcriptional regulator [Paenibacillus psychroresistens]
MISSKDVAKRAGVSQPTVSRVLNNPESVKPEKRNKVLQAMEELGYYPNLIARSLVTNSTRTIALISGTLKNGFFAETTDSIIHIAKQKGYKTIVYFEDENEDEITDYWDSIMGHKVDGILLSLIRLDDPNLKKLVNSQIPCVFFNRRPRNESNFVVLDNVMAASLLTQHLLDLGHQRIAYISGKTDVSTFNERKLGFEETMQQSKIKQIPELIHFINTSNDEIDQLIPKLIHRAEPPTAIICATDAMALICIDIVMSMGLRIPEDISIAGIDDTRMASHQAFQLTTVGHQKLAMGEIAALNLIEMIEESSAQEPLRQIILKPELVIRKTTAHLVK